MRRKRIAALLAAAVLLAGCGADGEKEEESGPKEETTEETTEESNEASTEAETEETTEEAAGPTGKEIREAFAALAAAIPQSDIQSCEKHAREIPNASDADGSSGSIRLYDAAETGYFLLDLDGNGVPELVRMTGQEDPEVTLYLYDRTSGNVNQMTENGILSFIPGTGDFILSDEDVGEDTEKISLQKYHLDDGTVEEEESGSIESDYLQGNQVLAADGKKTDAEHFLSVFDVDHAMTLSFGWNAVLAEKILQNAGKTDPAGDAGLYLSYLLSREEGAQGTDSYTYLDLDGDGSRELIVNGMDGVSIYTILDGQLVPLHECVGTIEYCTVDASRNLMFLEGPNGHDWNYAWKDALTLRDGMLFGVGHAEHYFSSAGEEADDLPQYREASYLNGVMLQDDDARSFEEVTKASAGDPVRKSADDGEAKTWKELLSILVQESGGAGKADSWWMQSYAMTLEGLLEKEIFLSNGQAAWDNLDDVRYQLLDLDGNGRPELLVGGEDEFDVLLPRKGTTCSSAAPFATNTAWNRKTKEIHFDDMASEYVNTDYGYRIDGDEAQYIESVSWIWHDSPEDSMGLYQTPDHAEAFDPDDPPREVTALENLENDVPEDRWKDLTYENILLDFGSLPDEIVPSEVNYQKNPLVIAAGDAAAKLDEVLSQDMTSWQKSYSMALTALLEKHMAGYAMNSVIGGSADADLAFQLRDCNDDGTPELLVRDFADERGNWVLFHPVDGCAAEPVHCRLLLYSDETGVFLYYEESVMNDQTNGYELGYYDGSGLHCTEYILADSNAMPQAWYHVNAETGEKTAITEEQYDSIWQQWVDAIQASGTSLDDQYTALTEDAVVSALGARLEPVFSENTAFSSVY